jgi:hypothetical protein
MNSRPNLRARIPANLVRSIWRSSALRAAAALGFSGLALAVGNLLLARILPTEEFARFTLFFSIVQIGISTGPLGADVIITRRHIHPGAALHRQVLLHSALVAFALAVVAGSVYQLGYALLALLLISITAGGVKVVPTSYYRSRQRFRAAMLLTMSTSASIFIAAGAAFLARSSSALLPAAAMAASLCTSAWIGWRAIATASGIPSGSEAPYPVREAWSAVSFIAATMVLGALERLITPKLLDLTALATLSVLAIACSPFQMLHMGVGYTLVPALRNAADRPARIRVLLREGLVVVAVCFAAAVAVWVLTPWIVRAAGRYVIPGSLLSAGICLGVIKVISSLASAAVNSLGSTEALAKLSIAGWLSIGIAIVGGWIGSRYGLTGLVCGVALGWLLRAAFVSRLALSSLVAADASSMPLSAVRTRE